MLMPLHILAGTVAIMLGAGALLTAKGSWLHRRIGTTFVVAMLLLGMTGAILALRQSVTNPNALGGLMAVYFVTTAYTTVRRSSAGSRWLNGAALVIAIPVTVAWFYLGARGLMHPRPGLDPMMVYSTFVFGTAMTLAIVGDVRLWRARRVASRQKLGRHLWRMCVSLFIAVASFFAITDRVAKILPAPFTTPAMRALPVLLVLIVMFYWLWRIRRSLPSTIRASVDTPPQAV